MIIYCIKFIIAYQGEQAENNLNFVTEKDKHDKQKEAPFCHKDATKAVDSPAELPIAIQFYDSHETANLTGTSIDIQLPPQRIWRILVSIHHRDRILITKQCPQT